ncbi:MAG: hypothetical protein IJR14_06000 [Synergistaceae bacterium]|nr:hypothetical protein [Synergistaceae bacterium]
MPGREEQKALDNIRRAMERREAERAEVLSRKERLDKERLDEDDAPAPRPDLERRVAERLIAGRRATAERGEGLSRFLAPLQPRSDLADGSGTPQCPPSEPSSLDEES